MTWDKGRKINPQNRSVSCYFIKRTKNMIEPLLELVIPPELARFTEFQGIYVKNDFLRSRTGLFKGCLAVFITLETEIKDGALGVVSLKDGRDLIGFVSRAFGAIALEIPFYSIGYLDVEVFNDGEVAFVGRIVGYCEPPIEGQDKHHVKLIKISPEPELGDAPPITFYPI